MPRLLEQARSAVRLKHYCVRTEEVYLHWVKEYILFHRKRHPSNMGAQEVSSFLSHLATDKHVAASTQNQAASALIFLYRELLGQPCLGSARCRRLSSLRACPSSSAGTRYGQSWPASTAQSG